MRVLLIEDDQMIGKSLVRAFADNGVSVDWARGGEEGMTALDGTSYALVLLDLGLPKCSGLDILRAMRRGLSTAPVLIVTARDDVETRVAGLDLGADDYVVKPFDFDELSARMHAVLRRHAGHATSNIETTQIVLDLANRGASYRGVTHVLPAREFALLYAFVERPGTILSRAQLEDRLYGWGEEVASNAIEVLIHYVRRKFGKDIIRNVRSLGWAVDE
jgi:DNA-binding response OmpR family regulator